MILDMDDVLAVSQQFTSYQVKMAFKLGDLEYPELWSNLILPEARENLRCLHNEFWPQYVISTSWSTFLSRDEMCEMFRRTEMHFIADNLHKHWTTPKGTSTGRLKEISDWLRLYRGKKQPVLILDDHASGWNLKDSILDREKLVVLCNPWVGFVREKLSEAHQALANQMPKD